MFSRYRKTEGKPAKPANGAAPAQPDTGPAGEAAAASAPATIRRAAPKAKTAAQVATADKERRRKERLAES